MRVWYSQFGSAPNILAWTGVFNRRAHADVEIKIMTWIDVLGYAASASVLVTLSTMVPLRVVAICSNVLFASFGALAHIYPVLGLHVILLPVNVARLMQILGLIKGVRAIQLSEISIDSMLPFMSHRFVKAGQVLMSKGDKADPIYYLVSGTMKIPELGKIIGPAQFSARSAFLLATKNEWQP